MFSLKYKLSAFIRHSLLTLSILLSLTALTPLAAQPALAATATTPNQCASVNSACNCTAANLNKNNCGIIYYVWLFINVLSGLVGMVLVITIVVAGIQWTTAGDNPQQISAARNRIVNAVIALLVFVFMYAFLQWVVPGGIF